jgi:AraC-like DNA-binding protein
VIEASKERPYLALLLKLDQRAIAEMMVDCNLPRPRGQQPERGMIHGEGTLPLFEAFHRLVTLLDEPDDIPILAPLIQRELLYRLIMSDQGERLRQIASAGSPGNQTTRAIGWLKAHFAEPLRIEDLAARSQMSPSTFHHHFRSLTAMSPLQYQKWLRLSEARRLMLAERLDAATASVRVGYESPSQFSREYRRLFGAPPSRDIASLRQAASA